MKSNTYNSLELPVFKPSDIPALLKYRNERMVITDVPHYGISSLWTPECNLGMYVLRTIESIRAVETDSKDLFGRFPSQNPILVLRNSDELKFVFDEKSHKAAARAYDEWWNSPFLINDRMRTDPLKGTDYRWH